MKYKMKCPFCGADTKYIEDKNLENNEFIFMDCPICISGFLIPKHNPYLKISYTEKLSLFKARVELDSWE